jgi:hypothetical protein
MVVHRLHGEGASSPLPPSAEPPFRADAFVVCPASLWSKPAGSPLWCSEVYRLAFEQAQTALMPTLYERARQVIEN